ncbi:hypothetical protein LguiA_006849 [Lonicera macranthoides]
MTISKALIASLLLAFVVLQLVHAHQETIVVDYAPGGASYRQGQICARGRVERAVSVATAYHRALLGTKMFVPAMPT